MIKNNDRPAFRKLHRLEHRAIADAVFLSVGPGQREIGKALPHFFFLSRMNVVQIFHQVGDDGHAGVGNPQRARLGLPKFRQGFRCRHAGCLGLEIMKRRELHVVKWQPLLRPHFAPAVDQRRHFVGVNFAVRPLAHAVGFALIPERAANGEAGHWRDHRVIQHHRPRVGGLVRSRRGCECQVIEPGHGFKSDRWRPRLDAGAAPVGTDQADGHVQFLLDLTREKIADGGKFELLQRV